MSYKILTFLATLSIKLLNPDKKIIIPLILAVIEVKGSVEATNAQENNNIVRDQLLKYILVILVQNYSSNLDHSWP